MQIKQINLSQTHTFIPGVMGIPDACEKLGQNFDVTSLGPKLMINSGAGSICYDVEKQKKVGMH